MSAGNNDGFFEAISKTEYAEVSLSGLQNEWWYSSSMLLA